MFGVPKVWVRAKSPKTDSATEMAQWEILTFLLFAESRESGRTPVETNDLLHPHVETKCPGICFPFLLFHSECNTSHSIALYTRVAYPFQISKSPEFSSNLLKVS